MATHSSMPAWKTPWTEEPSKVYSSWGRKESDTTGVLHFPLSACICQFQSPNAALPLTPGNHKFVSTAATLFLFCKQVHLHHF